MEKKEAVREWCLDKAIYTKAIDKLPIATEEVIKTAKEFEKYIIGSTNTITKGD